MNMHVCREFDNLTTLGYHGLFLTFEDEARSASSFGGLGCILGSFGAPVGLGVGGNGG